MFVRFRGGPMGGEEREIPRDWMHGRLMRVPSLPSPTVSYISNNGDLPDPWAPVPLTVEEYELSRSLSDRDGYEARWVNPNANLIRHNEELRARITELEAFEGAMQAFKVLQEALAR